MSDLGKAAQARRYYHHVLNGGTLTPENVSIMVQTIEELEAANARLRVSATERERKAVLRGVEQEVRAEAAEAKLATARNDALDAIIERMTPYKRVAGDPGYRDVMCVRKDGQWLNKNEVLAVIRALKSTSQT